MKSMEERGIKSITALEEYVRERRIGFDKATFTFFYHCHEIYDFATDNETDDEEINGFMIELVDVLSSKELIFQYALDRIYLDEVRLWY